MAVEAFEIGEEAITKPFKGIFVKVFLDVVLPNESILRVIERVKLVEQHTS